MRCFLLHNLASESLERPVPDPGALVFLRVSNRSRTIAVNYKNDKTFPGKQIPFISFLQSADAGQPRRLRAACANC